MSGIHRVLRAFASTCAVRTVAVSSWLSSVAIAATTEAVTEPVTAQTASQPLLEPSTLLLVGVGLIGLAVYRARYRDQK